MKLPELSHLGACPQCHDAGACLNVRKDHWGCCTRCSTRWRIGSNLFSSWQHETEADWQRNIAELEQCQVVQPALWEWAEVRPADLGRCLREWARFFSYRLLPRRVHALWAARDDVPF